ncbi:stemmadenine O-acetyltransferase-like [Humulus lupulus]|uniref:stemmadenine O-acetyltransferase-like n=1 Tax=Humulus lupulus TaxID=3486 RepID=UPI002B40BBCA|nr:stemmadenine O-acetyltransferase-like [Humulus lupulus]
MAEEMKIEIIKRETIKPSSPTPPHLKIHALSLLDQFQPVLYGQVVYFYPSQNDITSDQTSHQLKKSLAETLARFYPVAGRINNNTTIDCNDEGAQYVEARFHGLLSTVLKQRPAILQQFFAAKMQSPESDSWPQLLVQATFFDCGGLAVGICLSHKSCDATSMGIFMKSWAEISNGSGQTVFPEFNGASYFPRVELSVQKPVLEFKKVDSVTKRFVFDKPKLVKLKAETASDSVQQPTRVEVVTALIWKCIMAASRSNASGPKRFALTQSMNIRKRVDPPLPEHLVGNIVGYYAAQMEEHELAEATLQGLVALLRKGIREYSETKAKMLREEGASELLCRDLKEAAELFSCEDTKVLIFTSLCNFELYEAVDFGWGKPIWVAVPAAESHSNVVILMDTRDGGVEASVSLTKDDMSLFETDPQLLPFAYLSTQNYS